MINLKIKTNGTVRNLTLPYPGQSIPDIIEKNSVVTVSEVTEPESLKYMEGHEWNIDEINFLAKRMESLREIVPYQYWYTPYIERDHHVDFDDLPPEVEEVLSYATGEDMNQNGGMGY